MQKKLLKAELIGIFFVIIFSVFLQNLYDLSDHTLIGVLAGSVNDSIWEIEKTLLLPYIIWGGIEILSLKMSFRKFVVAKVISLWFLAVTFSLFCLIFSLSGSQNHTLPEFTIAIICVIFSSFLSYKIMLCDYKVENLFYPAFFMLLLFIAIFCSFTPFPPHLYLFMDRQNGLYGLIPENFDIGAVYLDNIFVS